MNTRIWMISYLAPPLYGGAGTQALRLAKGLQGRGISASILTARHSPGLPAQQSLVGVRIRYLPVLRAGRLRALSFSLAVAWHLYRHRRLYDIIHIHGAYWRMLPLLLVAKLAGKRSIVKLTQMGTDDPSTIRRRQLGSVLLGAVAIADTVVATTDELAGSYAHAGLPSDRLVRIPNGVDTSVFSPVASEARRELRMNLGLPPGAPVVLFVGAVNWRKGADLLLAAWRSVQDGFPEATLVLAGPISTDPRPLGRPFAEYVRGYIADHVPPQRIRVLGQQAEVQCLYQAADVFVLPSRMEGLPNALLEAMSCGLPAVATAVGGAPEVIANHTTGVLVPPGDVDALSNAISHLLQHPGQAKRLGRAARQTIGIHFSMDAVVDQYAALYASMMSSGA
jgi:glycosyltransferase involved in cell wall biosynthesis